MEVDHEEWRKDGFFFDELSFKLDLYRLITCFYASVTFAEFGDDIDEDPVRYLQANFEENEITRLLVSIAITVRTMDERDKFISSRFALECGQLVPNTSEPNNTEPLTIREACNKIIHSKRFNWDIEKLKEENLPYPTTQFITPTIYLYGVKEGKTWKATLDITKFVRHNAELWKG